MPISPSSSPFHAASQRLARQTILPTTASTFELAQLPAAARERALFSARVMDADFLQRLDELLTRGISGGNRDENGNYIPGSYVNLAKFRGEMRDYLASISYQPPEDQQGTLKDLSSDPRLDVIWKTNVDMAQGYGAFIQQQDPASLDAYPAQELYRLEDRKQRRPWGQRWNDAIQSIGLANTSAIPVSNLYADSGMFALVNDPIWTAISRFGLPYPPFDFGSGMWVRDIPRSQAQDLGLLAPGDPAPAPDQRGFNDDLQADLSGLAKGLQDALSGFGKFIDGIFYPNS